MTNNGQIKLNASAHNAVAHAYDSKHSDIYNDIEQHRIRQIVKDVVAGHAGTGEIHVLDFGAGTGNLTRCFLERGCRVTACDVSAVSLDLLRAGMQSDRLGTLLLDGQILPVRDHEFDLVVTYSVLHHVPDYLYAVKELIRVLKPGGQLYIDHEFNEHHWAPDGVLAEYYAKTRFGFVDHLVHLVRHGDVFSWSLYKTALMKLFVNRRYEREGDIHVWPDDHVDWDKVLDVIREQCTLVRNEDYLFYRPRGGMVVYQHFRHRCNDMKFVVARKRLE
jgi:ubiquinone/menaquinone biosynthesis C-methylase UbiE